MPRQSFIWTALPRGVKKVDASLPGVGLELSVFVTPRLQHQAGESGPLTLADFGDLLDWPATVGTLGFLVTFDRGVPLPTADVTRLVPGQADSERWKALFREDLRVDPYTFDDLSGETWLSYPAGELARRIREGYVDATQPGAGGGVDLIEVVGALERLLFQTLTLPATLPPLIEPVVAGLPAPAITGALGAKLLTGVLGTVAGQPPVTVPGLPAIPSPLADFLGFHRPPQRTTPPRRLERDQLEDLLDFHQIVSALGDHPAVLRALGLVVDLTIVVPPALARVLLSVHTVQVRPIRIPKPGDLPTLDVSPATACFLDGDLFLSAPRPNDPETAQGLLDLADGRYQVEQFDIDGAVFKIQGEERSVGALAATLSPTMPRNVGLPALRSGQISVVRDDLAERFAAKAKQAADRNAIVETAERIGALSADAGDLFAEDVTAGYRVDVWDDVSRAWHSLHRRESDFNFVREPERSMPGVANEGMVQTVATRHPPPDEGKPPPTGGADNPVFVTPSVLTWEGWSLSAPRPGLHIDPDEIVAGPAEEPQARALNSIKLDVTSRTTADSQLPRLRYGRTYRFRARLADLAGNSRDLDEPGLRVRPEQLPECSEAIRYGRFEPVATPFVVMDHAPKEGESVEWIVARSDPLDRQTLPGARDHRDLAAPRVGQLMAEQHGAFDGPVAMDRSEATYLLIVRRDRGEFKAAPPVEPPARPDHIDRKPASGPLDIPYLPDPLARGVLLVGLPGAPLSRMPDDTRAALTHVPFVGQWPDPSAVRLAIQGILFGDKPAEPVLVGGKPGQRDSVLTVQVPESHIVTVRMSCYIVERSGRTGAPTAAERKELGLMGLWQWIEQLAPEADKARLRKEAVLGRNWLLMPHRDITLVHAVQRPVEPPRSVRSSLTIEKLPADTSATVGVTTEVHGFSTSKVELLAAWTDPIDDGVGPTGTTDASHKVTLGEHAVRRSDSQVEFENVKQHFGDTKHHLVSYSTLATTSFREYFPPATPPPDFTRPSDPANTIIEHVPSSSRPAAPGVVAAVPAFAWERTATTSLRRSRTVRVYLERPWFSSGLGEQVAVIFVEGGPLAEGDPRARLVSSWGVDPAWSSVPTGRVRRSMFLASHSDVPAPVRTRLTLEELPARLRVSAAIYKARFDPDRQLRFADVTLKTGSYFPFVRLAIARFQAHSLPGMELSTVKLTDFVQLAPDRRASVAVRSSTDPEVKLRSFRLSGAIGRRSPGPPSPVAVRNRVRARVVKQQTDGRWVDEGPPIEVTAQAAAGGRQRTWTGNFGYPADGGPRRLVIEEVEEYRNPPAP